MFESSPDLRRNAVLDTPAFVRIVPDAIYAEGELRLLLDLPSATLTRERRSGRLRSRRVGPRTYYLGRWVLEWLAGEEARRE
jgi:hypothetical protein